MSKFYCNTTNTPKGIPVKILERGICDELLGEYKGYYNHKAETFTLYPASNPFAINNGRLAKKVISARLVNYP